MNRVIFPIIVYLSALISIFPEHLTTVERLLQAPSTSIRALYTWLKDRIHRAPLSQEDDLSAARANSKISL